MASETRSSSSQEPIVRKPDEGQALWWFNSLAVVKAGARETDGRLTVMEITEPPNEAAPLHVHHREDEAFWIIEGSATFVIGDQSFEVGSGDFLYGPRGIPHSYTTGPDGCRLLFILTPGGLDEMVAGMSRPAERLELPPPADDEPDWERIAQLASSHGNEILG